MDESAYDRINDYGAVKIGLASPYDIRSWSFGEVKKPETINYRTYRPEKDGLFCERIFGPEKDWECACGRYIGQKYKGMICERCGVKVTHSRVRRKRMGHIELAAPVAHIWFWKARPSRLGILLDMKASCLNRVIYFQDYVVVDPGVAPLKERQILTEEDFRKAREQFGDTFQADMGADAVRKLLARLDLVGLSKQLRQELTETSSKQKIRNLTRRLKVVESLRDSDNRPEWMVLECIPVIPPDLRPFVLLDSGNFATSDLNDLYRQIINRNYRLKTLIALNAQEVIIRNEKRMLQQAVDALFDNNRCKRPVLGSSNRPLKSLTDMIKGKLEPSRESPIGKRVDYSARSVMVPGPALRLDQCGLPKKIALELFQPFLIRQLRELGHADTIKSAKQMLERRFEVIWDILREVMRTHPVLLNRKPTLQRSNLRAFFPILVEGSAIQIPPLACEGFAANFDGAQVAVHLPLSIEAQVEAMTLMMPSQNFDSIHDGRPTIGPVDEILLGLRYMTSDVRGETTAKPAFHRSEAVHLALTLGKLKWRDSIRLRIPKRRKLKGIGEEGHRPGGWIETTAGRVVFNDELPRRMPYYNSPVDRRAFWTVLDDCRRRYGHGAMVTLIDVLKTLGFRAATRSGITLAIDDLRLSLSKSAIVDRADIETDRTADLRRRGEIGEAQPGWAMLRLWTDARQAPASDPGHKSSSDETGRNLESGEVKALSDKIGLVTEPSRVVAGKSVRSRLSEGLSIHDYLMTARSTRRGLADQVSSRDDADNLTRKIGEAAQDVVITMEDCGTVRSLSFAVVGQPGVARIIRGRISASAVFHPGTGSVLVSEGELLSWTKALGLVEAGVEEIRVRSPLTCEASIGICRRCYGADYSTGRVVEAGMAVGIIAAQGLGEPIARATTTVTIGGAGEVRERVARIIALLEAREPRRRALLAEIDGRVEFVMSLRNRPVIRILGPGDTFRDQVATSSRKPRVGPGDLVKAGDVLVDGEVSPHDLFRILGIEPYYHRLRAEIESNYRACGARFDLKHLEIILARMLRKVRVDSVGDTGLLPGSVIDKFEFRGTNQELMSCVKIKDPGDTDFRQGDIVPRDHFDQENLRVEQAGSKKAEWIRPKPASATTQFLGITKAAVQSESFISAASFQETTKVLTEAALAGKVDYLVGLKENVILGHLVPAGTGFKSHQEAEVRIRPEALEALAEKGPAYSRSTRDELSIPNGSPLEVPREPVVPKVIEMDAMPASNRINPDVIMDPAGADPGRVGYAAAEATTAPHIPPKNSHAQVEDPDVTRDPGVLDPVVSIEGDPRPGRGTGAKATTEDEVAMPEISPRLGRIYAGIIHALVGIVQGQNTGRVFVRRPWEASGRPPHQAEGLLVCYYSYTKFPVGLLPEDFPESAPDLIVSACPTMVDWRAMRRRTDDYLDAGTRVFCLLEPDRICVHTYYQDRPESISLGDDSVDMTPGITGFSPSARFLYGGRSAP